MAQRLTVDLDGIDAVFLDLDGTLHMGWEPIPGVHAFLERLERAGIARRFLSNNSSKSVDAYVERLSAIGIAATPDEVLLSTHGLLAGLAERGVTRIWLVGTASMGEMVQAAGIEPWSEDPQLVIVGYDTEVTYEKLATASIHLHRGVGLVASHPDLVCPSPDGGLPDAGAYLALLETTTGVAPEQIYGKPDASMLGPALASLSLTAAPERTAMVGDRLYTDMALARNTGCRGILVLTGEATRAEAEAQPVPPDLVVASVADLVPKA